ncbi:MAG: efflux RND transporter periplasmic adaptor subunit [Rhodospirillales bacterium]|nr:efflux RND transporter periplasmic adaptor subunit [Rhodospirillales bacterium]
MARFGRIVGFSLLAALGGVVAWRLWNAGGGAKRTATPPVLVEVAPAQIADVAVYLDALGTVVPYRTVTVQPMITGPLARVLFHQGQDVASGDLLAEIDPAPYQAALAQAEAKLAQDRASLANAELQARQYASLVKQNYTSKQQAATAASVAAQDRALVQQDLAAIQTDRINLGYTRIRAPIPGRTGILQVDPGNIVTPSLAGGIVTINTIQPISVQFSLPQQDLGAVQDAGRAGPVEVLAVGPGDPASATVLDRGTLAVLDNAVNANTGTLTLKATFPNPKRDLWPGAFVDVRLRARVIAHAVTVPPVALQQGPSGAFVYLVGHGASSVTMRPVTIGYQSATAAVIEKGLAAGDQVVTEGTARLHEGAAIRIVAPTPATK